MAKALLNSEIIADSNKTIVIEGNHYFPRESVKMENLQETDKHTTCPWKGEASYFNVKADGRIAENAAWTYHSPKDAASEIKEYIAFWKDVKVEA